MIQTKTIFGKVIFTVLVMFMLFSVGGIFTASTNANSEGAVRSMNAELLRENLELRTEFKKLESELIVMEDQIQKIRQYDNIIYAQVLGVDFDTTGFAVYRNDSVDYILDQHNDIFSEVTDRAFYAAEMLSLQLIKLQETSDLFKNNKNSIYYYPTISPIKTKDFVRLSSPYGWRHHPTEKKTLFHEGIDIAAVPGTPVYSTAQGKIIKIMYSEYGYGNRVLIKHAYGFETLYAHLGAIKVHKGQWVRKNQLIGTVGNTGRSTGPHLHYEIRKYGEPRDPLGYFYTNITDELLAMK